MSIEHACSRTAVAKSASIPGIEPSNPQLFLLPTVPLCLWCLHERSKLRRHVHPGPAKQALDRQDLDLRIILVPRLALAAQPSPAPTRNRLTLARRALPARCWSLPTDRRRLVKVPIRYQKERARRSARLNPHICPTSHRPSVQGGKPTQISVSLHIQSTTL